MQLWHFGQRHPPRLLAMLIRGALRGRRPDGAREEREAKARIGPRVGSSPGLVEPHDAFGLHSHAGLFHGLANGSVDERLTELNASCREIPASAVFGLPDHKEASFMFD